MGFSVLIADDHELFRQGLRLLLTDTFEGVKVRETSSFEETLQLITADGAGELLLMDLSMPGLAGAQSLSALADGFPNSKVVVVSASESRSDILAALDAGVRGYLPKSMASHEIAAALISIVRGQIFVPAALVKRGPHAPPGRPPQPSARLTSRQEEVLQELLKGKSSKEIARQLGIAEGTVKIHLAAIYRAFGVRGRAEAIAKLS